jgi:hypothetical protein
MRPCVRVCVRVWERIREGGKGGLTHEKCSVALHHRHPLAQGGAVQVPFVVKTVKGVQ